MNKHIQNKALIYVKEYGKEHSREARDLINSILHYSNIEATRFEDFCQLVLEKATIHLHFHPDRPTRHHDLVIERLLKEGIYKNQFETQLSAGSVSAISGGKRDIWEEELFGGLYQQPKVLAQDRPKYGALSMHNKIDGAAPRFGSCYLVLKPQIKTKCTFTYGDSYLLPKERGTIMHFDMIWAKLLEDIFIRNFALGNHYPHVSAFLEETFSYFSTNQQSISFSHNLDFYIEAQIHQDILLEKDATALVADISFKNTEIEPCLIALCQKYALSLTWNTGIYLTTKNFPDNFRGAIIPSFAEAVSQDGIINPYIIGKTAQTLAKTPSFLSEFGTHLEITQLLKYLWHCLVKFGEHKP